jgi:hypothetical protein
MASTAGSVTTEIIYCANKAQVAGGDAREAPLTCEQELADRINAFRLAHGDPTSIATGVSKTPQGEDVYVVVLVKLA